MKYQHKSITQFKERKIHLQLFKLKCINKENVTLQIKVHKSVSIVCLPLSFSHMIMDSKAVYD